jgi:hypothetical protein
MQPVIVTCHFCKKQADFDKVWETWIPYFTTKEGKQSEESCCTDCLDKIITDEDGECFEK